MQRLSKILMLHGISSRRKIDEMIKDKKVKVNGNIIDKPFFQVDMEKDEILLNNKPLPNIEKKWYILLNKPKGFICTNDTNISKNKKRVVDLFSNIKERIYTIGRLDKNTSGLIFLTNDGDFANMVIHPKYNIEKEYLVKVSKFITHEDLVCISEGINIGRSFVKPTFVKKVRKNCIKVGVKEGKKHEVRKLVKKINVEILELKRIRIGAITLGQNPEGFYRNLTKKEIDYFIENAKKIIKN